MGASHEQSFQLCRKWSKRPCQFRGIFILFINFAHLPVRTLARGDFSWSDLFSKTRLFFQYYLSIVLYFVKTFFLNINCTPFSQRIGPNPAKAVDLDNFSFVFSRTIRRGLNQKKHQNPSTDFFFLGLGEWKSSSSVWFGLARGRTQISYTSGLVWWVLWSVPTSVWKQKAKKKRQEKAIPMKNSTRMGEDETKSLNSIDFWSDGSSEEGEITSLQPTSSLHLSRGCWGRIWCALNMGARLLLFVYVFILMESKFIQMWWVEILRNACNVWILKINKLSIYQVILKIR